ncbi:MAG: 2-oxoacid:acceptor oxidoreductase subunit alpha [Thermoleophilia bacterium]|nr:2-oxoacid:acceptor oxidoreductase subunit alpha [Thermoleophilia bacterium]
MDYTIMIGGQAGQGLQTIGSVLGKLFARMSYQVFSHQDYESRIRGGHNFYQVRFSDSPISCSRRGIDILIALDKTTVQRHEHELNPGGLVIYDSEAVKEKYESPVFLDVPFRQLAEEAAGSRLMENTVAVGAVMGIMGMDLKPLEKLLSDTFLRKGQDIVDRNVAAAKAGSDYAEKYCERCEFTVTEPGEGGRLMFLDGATAVALGALLSGCRFYAAYPMTPSTGILTYLAAASKKHSLVVEQAEDEIAAINMAIGASYAGVRAMTGTAGGGFALMVEGLSLAGMTETPVVIYVGMRPAPATGFPTRTEQGDLLYVTHAAHGEFPRVIMAPGTPAEAFYLTNKAFDLAEKYQVPAIILMDQYLADSEWSLPELETSKLVYRDYRLRTEELDTLKAYKRHEFTDSGVTPLAEPGASRHLVVTDSDEHDEEGHIVEDAETRIKMVEKRLLKKLLQIKSEMSPPRYYGPERPETLVACWGSNLGVVGEAVKTLRDGQSIGMLHFNEIWPLPCMEEFDWMNLLDGAGRTICLENNATSQFARLIRMETGFEFDERINRYDGRPFLLEEVVEKLRA